MECARVGRRTDGWIKMCNILTPNIPVTDEVLVVCLTDLIDHVIFQEDGGDWTRRSM